MIRLIFGEETYLLDQAVETSVSGISMPEMNVTEFGDGYDVEAVEQICFTEPFLSKQRAVILRLTELRADEGLKKLVGRVPAETIMVVAADKVDKRSALYKAFRKNTLECNKPGQREIFDLVRRVAEKDGRTAGNDATAEMIKRLNYYDDAGINLYAVIGCVRQLAQSGDITLPLVRAMLPESSAGKAWNLLTLICERRMTEAFSLLAYLLDSGESAIGLLSLVLRGFRLAWKESAGVLVEGNLRYQYAPAAGYPAKDLFLIQEILEKAVMQMKSGAEADTVSRLALVKVSGVLQNQK